MIDRRHLFTLMAALAVTGPALAQLPPVQPDGGAGGSSSSGGAMGGGMSADDENAQGVEAGREGPMRPSPANRQRGLQDSQVRGTPRPTPQRQPSRPAPQPRRRRIRRQRRRTQ
ncbi:hypothetical protein E8L99_17050 [Phreatobacter aquaticus]|uniref:Uncharacterized protein n=1 Tax=Phreatobacter aquaticus TaxID=2570229 RepID=A0A4D7QTK5_9HYPH|nr:hypothetical protein [Phreatobacter aquaticus]QCK87342.1 hypothetical protein E8L99_17050 [Phreatobacter aquaticus]